MDTFANGIPMPKPGMLVKFKGHPPYVITNIRQGRVGALELRRRNKITTLAHTEADWCVFWKNRKGKIIQASDLTASSYASLMAGKNLIKNEMMYLL